MNIGPPPPPPSVSLSPTCQHLANTVVWLQFLVGCEIKLGKVRCTFYKRKEGESSPQQGKGNTNPVFNIYWVLYSCIHLALSDCGWVGKWHLRHLQFYFCLHSKQFNVPDPTFRQREHPLPPTLSYFNHISLSHHSGSWVYISTAAGDSTLTADPLLPSLYLALHYGRGGKMIS